MEKTPVLNKKQINHSLSAKKSRNKETIKNVLSTPYKNYYWPQSSLEDSQYIKAVLTDNLPWIKETHLSPPYSEIKNISKDERKAFRREYTKKVLKENKHKENNEGLILGINSVTKMLERNSASVVMIEDDIHPKLMVQHVIDMCILYNVAFIILKKLSTILASSCGVGSICCALKKDIPPNSKLHLIKEAVEKIFEKYPKPKQHLNFKRTLLNEHRDDVIIRERQKPEQKQFDENAIRNTIYLCRKSKNERTFIPPDSQKLSKVNDIMECSFIPISSDSTKRDTYVPLTVKRYKGDISRNKRKIAKLKQNI